jgi:hypothetical protein
VLTLGALPLVLLLIGLLASFSHSDSARIAFRWFRWIIAVEIIVLVVAAVIGLVYEKVSASRARRQYPAPGKLIDMGGSPRLRRRRQPYRCPYLWDVRVLSRLVFRAAANRQVHSRLLL